MRLFLRSGFVLFLLLLTASTAGAAFSKYEYVERKGILNVEDFQQNVTVTYTLLGQERNGNSAFSHHLNESYNTDFTANIVDPEIVEIKGTTSISFDHSISVTNSNSLFFNYDLTALVLKNSVFPLRVFSSHSIGNVVSQFSPTYFSESYRNGIEMKLYNQLVPITLHYENFIYDTSRAGNDSSRNSNYFMVQAQNNYQNSQTTLRTSYTGSNNNVSSGADTSSAVYTVSLSNALTMGRTVLTTSASINESRLEAGPERNINLAELLNHDFGKTLRGHLELDYDSTTTAGFSGAVQEMKKTTIRGGLDHKLFASLQTGTSGFYTRGIGLGGDENSYGGSVTARYSKLLPSPGLFSLTVTKSYQVTDRNVAVAIRQDTRQVANVNQGDLIVLTDQGNLNGVSQVCKPVSATIRDCDVIYEEGRDYTVLLPLGRVRVEQGGTIEPGTDLVITYTTGIDRSIKYLTDSISTGASLSLFQNRYNLAVHYSENGQKRIDASNDSVLTSSSSLGATFTAHYTEHTFGLAYTSIDSGTSSSDTASASWSYSHQPWRGGSLFLNAYDSYTKYGGSGLSSTATDYSENVVSGGIQFSQAFGEWGRGSSGVTYLHGVGGGQRRDNVYGKISFSTAYRSLSLSLWAQTLWRSVNSDETRDDTVQVTVTRNF